MANQSRALKTLVASQTGLNLDELSEGTLAEALKLVSEVAAGTQTRDSLGRDSLGWNPAPAYMVALQILDAIAAMSNRIADTLK